MADSDSSISEMGGSVSSGEVWSAHSEDWEISSQETDLEETFRERVDYSPISHYNHGRLEKRGKLEEDEPEEEDLEEDPGEEDPKEDEPEEKDAEEDDPEEEDLEEDDPMEDPMEDEDPEEEPMEWVFEVAQEPLLDEILEAIPLGWELEMDEDWAREDELMVVDHDEVEEQEEISLDGDEPNRVRTPIPSPLLAALPPLPRG